MRISKRNLILAFLLVVTFFLLTTFELPYYIYKPGHVDELQEMIEVEDAYDASGHISLVTVSGAQATPIQYVLAKVFDYNEIIPIEEARPEGMSEEEYMRYQLQLMNNSHDAAVVVAFRAAGEEVTVMTEGVRVMDIVPKMPAAERIEIGDYILQIDDKEIEMANELVEYVQTKEAGEEITLLVQRDSVSREETITVEPFPEDPTKVGVGLQLITDQSIATKRHAQIKSGSIGGPSAGLMFSLEMYNQLTEEDITKGYHLAGTGEIDMDGKVHRIGGVDKKVVAAHRAGVDVFFVPKESESEDSNYARAKETAEQLETTMEVVPVATFAEALFYLEALP